MIYVQLYYSSLARTILSLLHCITGGDWFNYLRPLIGASWVFVVLFSLYIVFIVLGALNILTGIFCEAAMCIKDRDHVIDQHMSDSEGFLEDMVGLFMEADTDKRGTLNWPTLQKYFTQERVIHFFLANELDISDVRLVFELLDKNEDGDIDAFEFAFGCLNMRGQAKALDLSRLAKHSAHWFDALSRRLAHLEGGLQKSDAANVKRFDALHDSIKGMRALPVGSGIAGPTCVQPQTDCMSRCLPSALEHDSADKPPQEEAQTEQRPPIPLRRFAL